MNGETFASSFGYTLAAVDIDGDHLQDLFVGAPFHFDYLSSKRSADGEQSTTSNKSNQRGRQRRAPRFNGGGAVYVYMNHATRGITQLPPVRLTGFKEESRLVV